MEQSSDQNSGPDDNDPQTSAAVETDPDKSNPVITDTEKSNSKSNSEIVEFNSQKDNQVESSESPENCNLSKVEGTENDTANGSELVSTHSIEESSVITSERDINKPAKVSIRKLMDISRRLMVLSYEARERHRQPFMNQGNQQGIQRQQPPPPPSYYTQQNVNQQRQRQQTQGQQAQQSRSPADGRVTEYRFHFTNFMPSMQFSSMNRGLQWASYPSKISDHVPSSLALLVDTEALFVIQQLNFVEFMTGLPKSNIYLVLNKNGECLYYVYETYGCFCSCFCSNSQAFQLHVLDVYDNEVIFMNKSCGSAYMFCCYPVMEIYSPPNVPLGAITKSNAFCRENFNIIDPDQNIVFKIKGQGTCKYFWGMTSLEITIHALDPQKTIVGLIKREYVSYIDQLANIDYYGISFPKDMDVRLKAVFLGAAFLFDALYFE